jgi:hypothetical protein
LVDSLGAFRKTAIRAARPEGFVEQQASMSSGYAMHSVSLSSISKREGNLLYILLRVSFFHTYQSPYHECKATPTSTMLIDVLKNAAAQLAGTQKINSTSDVVMSAKRSLMRHTKSQSMG